MKNKQPFPVLLLKQLGTYKQAQIGDLIYFDYLSKELFPNRKGRLFLIELKLYNLN